MSPALITVIYVVDFGLFILVFLAVRLPRFRSVRARVIVILLAVAAYLASLAVLAAMALRK